MKNSVVYMSIGSLITLIFMMSLMVLMDKGEAEIVVGDANGINPGVIEVYSGSEIPDGYLLCDGKPVSRTTYADLFSIIGTTYGSGDGSTTFNLPDLSGRVPVGVSNNTFTVLGSSGGSETSVLSTENMPSHNHTVTAEGSVTSTFTGSGITTSTTGEHTHKNTAKSSTISGNFGALTPGNHCKYASGAFGCDTVATNTSDAVGTYAATGTIYGYNFSATPTITMTNVNSGNHSHTVTAQGTVKSTFTGNQVTTSSTGSGESFTNLQPYVVMNYIIKY